MFNAFDAVPSYNPHMARGWESKSVEEQQWETQQRGSISPPRSEAERRRAQEQESLPSSAHVSSSN